MSTRDKWLTGLLIVANVAILGLYWFTEFSRSYLVLAFLVLNIAAATHVYRDKIWTALGGRDFWDKQVIEAWPLFLIMAFGLIIALHPLFTILGLIITLSMFYSWWRALYEIPPNPPQYGIKEEWGVAKKKAETGRTLLLFKGWWHDMQLISAEKRTLKVDVRKTTVPADQAEANVDWELLWGPDPDEIKAFLDIGKDKGVSENLTRLVESGTRDFINDPPPNGPKSLKDLKARKSDVAAKVVEEMLHKKLTAEEITCVINGHKGHELKLPLYGCIVYKIQPTNIRGSEKQEAELEKLAHEKAQRQAENFQRATIEQQTRRLIKDAKKAGQDLNYMDARHHVEWLNAIKDPENTAAQPHLFQPEIANAFATLSKIGVEFMTAWSTKYLKGRTKRTPPTPTPPPAPAPKKKPATSKPKTP